MPKWPPPDFYDNQGRPKQTYRVQEDGRVIVDHYDYFDGLDGGSRVGHIQYAIGGPKDVERTRRAFLALLPPELRSWRHATGEGTVDEAKRKQIDERAYAALGSLLDDYEEVANALAQLYNVAYAIRKSAPVEQRHELDLALTRAQIDLDDLAEFLLDDDEEDA